VDLIRNIESNAITKIVVKMFLFFIIVIFNSHNLNQILTSTLLSWDFD